MGNPAPDTTELNLDGLVGPTHNYAGLSYGNLASMGHGGAVSDPRAAALQGLGKMKLVADLGVSQAVLPPQQRPDLAALRALGFRGTDAQVLARAGAEAPHLLAACCSASSMWAANAATVSPGADTADGRVHVTPANLLGYLHRALEVPTTARLLARVLPEAAGFSHHAPLPAAVALADEGAANHLRLCAEHGARGVEVFVYGRTAFPVDATEPARFPARQTREASRSVARRHRLMNSAVVFARQAAAAVDAGVFHNDVVAVANQQVLFFHSEAYANRSRVLEQLRRNCGDTGGFSPLLIEVSGEELPLKEAVASYLFNSQLLSLPGGGMLLLAPTECEALPRVRGVVERVLAGDNPVRQVRYVNLRQSMRNGGGPACLRLRVAVTAEELAGVHPGVMLTEALYGKLVAWVERHYRDRLAPRDLADPALLQESRCALDELTKILGLGNVYPFQRETGLTKQNPTVSGLNS